LIASLSEDRAKEGANSADIPGHLHACGTSGLSRGGAGAGSGDGECGVPRRRSGREGAAAAVVNLGRNARGGGTVGARGGSGASAGGRGGIRRGADGNARRLWVVRNGERAALGIDSVNVVYSDEGDVIGVGRWNGWKTEIEHLGVRDDIITNSKGALGEQASLDVIVVQLDTKIGVILAICPCDLNSGVSRPSSRGRLSDHNGSRGERSQSGDGNNEEEREHG